MPSTPVEDARQRFGTLGFTRTLWTFVPLFCDPVKLAQKFPAALSVRSPVRCRLGMVMLPAAPGRSREFGLDIAPARDEHPCAIPKSFR